MVPRPGSFDMFDNQKWGPFIQQFAQVKVQSISMI